MYKKAYIILLVLLFLSYGLQDSYSKGKPQKKNKERIDKTEKVIIVADSDDAKENLREPGKKHKKDKYDDYDSSGNSDNGKYNWGQEKKKYDFDSKEDGKEKKEE